MKRQTVYEVEQPDPASGSAAFRLSDVVSAALRHWFIVLLLTVAGGAAGYYLATQVEDTYSAETVLISDAQKSGIIAVAGSDIGVADPSMTATIVETLSAPSVLSRSLESLAPEMRQRLDQVAFAETGPDEGTAEGRTAALRRHLWSNLEVVNSGRSYVIRVRYTSVDPELAAAAANAITDAYLDYRAELRGAASEQRLEDLGSELHTLKEELKQAERTAHAAREEVRVLASRSEALMGERQEEAIARSAELYAVQREAERDAEATAAVYERLLFLERDIQSRLTAPEQSVYLFSRAVVPTQPRESIIKLVILALGLAGGIFLGLSVAVFLHGRRHRRGAGA